VSATSAAGEAPQDAGKAPGAARLDAAMTLLCALAPACLAAAHVGNAADAAHDAGVARAMGLAAQPWRGLDVVAGSLLAWVPLGTRAARADLGSALVAGLAGVVVYRIARALAARCLEAPRLGALTAAVATLAALCAPVWQTEAAAVGGSAMGALLALVPLAVVARADDAKSPPPWRLAALTLGLAVGYEVLVGALAVVGIAAVVGAAPDARRRSVAAVKNDGRALAACLLCGLAPGVLAVARTRAAGVPLFNALLESWAGEAGASHAGPPGAFVRGELGTVLGAMAVGGVVVAALAPRARALAAALVAVTALGLASGWAGAPLGPTRFGAPVLAATAAACALAGATMQAVVRAIAEARVPMARASAGMVLVLELVLPVDSADESLVRLLPRAGDASALWGDLAWGTLPPRAVVLAADPRLGGRVAAAQAEGSLRGDITVIPTYARGAPVERVLATDSALVPLWRDLELAGAPSEASLSALATSRPLVTPYEPRWGRALGRHLVPVGLLDRFEPEPRGASDRRKALDAFGAKRDRLAKAQGKDPELVRATAYLLRARALDVAASGDRDLIGRAVDDLHVFAPEDPVATAIVARVVMGHGAAKVDDLRP
jgi:hypothetical protein